MSDFLERILASRREAVEASKASAPDVAGAPEPRDFRGALSAPGMSLIAEVKRASPSKGALNASLDPAALARDYERGGAVALSTLTEPAFFSGSAEDLQAAREATALPILWKDFLIDAHQVDLARASGADAVLLIVRILDDVLLRSMLARARELGMDALVEVFDEVDLGRAFDAGADVIGINHRDLETFEEDPAATKRLRPLVQQDVVVVAESAITTRADVETLEAIEVDAILVGEALVTSADPAAKVAELLGR